MGNSANFDGNYDKGSMLDPLVLTFRLERFDRSADHPSQSIRYLRIDMAVATDFLASRAFAAHRETGHGNGGRPIQSAWQCHAEQDADIRGQFSRLLRARTPAFGTFFFHLSALVGRRFCQSAFTILTPSRAAGRLLSPSATYAPRRLGFAGANTLRSRAQAAAEAGRRSRSAGPWQDSWQGVSAWW
jgi:hypothetical protein